MSALDDLFRRSQSGDREAFAGWVRRVEPAVRRSLRRFARSVDAESVVQETLLRMWVLAATLPLQGDDASLRYAFSIARNLAVREARRWSRSDPIEGEEDARAEIPVPPEPVTDPGLRALILACLRRLPLKPGRALAARLGGAGETSDPVLAERVGMTRNTFLQNIVRARRHLASCLESHGVRVEEFLR